MGKWVNFNTILGDIYDVDFDDILSDYRGESQLFILKKRIKIRALNLFIQGI